MLGKGNLQLINHVLEYLCFFSLLTGLGSRIRVIEKLEKSTSVICEPSCICDVQLSFCYVYLCVRWYNKIIDDINNITSNSNNFNGTKYFTSEKRQNRFQNAIFGAKIVQIVASKIFILSVFFIPGVAWAQGPQADTPRINKKEQTNQPPEKIFKR